MSEHTKGRLRVHTNFSDVLSFNPQGKGGVHIQCYGEDREANARRLVACWNVCEGIPTEYLERCEPTGEAALFAEELMRDRDELLAALRELLEAETAPYPRFEAGKDAQDAWAERKGAAEEMASALIAKHTPKVVA